MSSIRKMEKIQQTKQDMKLHIVGCFFFYFKRYHDLQSNDIACRLSSHLWNDGQSASQISKSKFPDVNAVDFNSTPWLC